MPAVAYRSGGGVGESIDDWQTGRLVDDVEELTKVAMELLTDDELRGRLGDAARERAGAFHWDSSARAFEAILDRATQA